jgi:hypothetical protein
MDPLRAAAERARRDAQKHGWAEPETRVARVERIPTLREYLQGLKNGAVVALFDSFKRLKLKRELLVQLKAMPPRGLLQFRLKPHNEAYAMFALVAEELRREHPEFTIMHWKGGNALCRRSDVEILKMQHPSIHEVNTAAGLVERSD